jgi:hypothetical protein
MVNFLREIDWLRWSIRCWWTFAASLLIFSACYMVAVALGEWIPILAILFAIIGAISFVLMFLSPTIAVICLIAHVMFPKHHFAPQKCQSCGYSLEGLRARKYPECGTLRDDPWP